MNLTEYALQGYAGAENPHAYSSPAWYAHRLGRYLHDSGRPPPRDVRMGRGYKVRVADMIFDMADDRKIVRVQ